MDQEDLVKTVKKLDAKAKIENVMGRYSFLLTAGKYREICDLFAKKAPDVRAELNWGIYEGYEGILKCYAKYHVDCISGPGVMAVHSLTTPVIEVADDLKTAKGVWVSPGHVTGGMFTESDEIKAHWAWMRYGNDFIFEDGEWKIWHLHVYGMFMSPFDQSWAETGDVHKMPEFRPEHKPDKPPTYSWSYNKDAVTELVPEPPLPHATYDPSKAY